MDSETLYNKWCIWDLPPLNHSILMTSIIKCFYRWHIHRALLFQHSQNIPVMHVTLWQLNYDKCLIFWQSPHIRVTIKIFYWWIIMHTVCNLHYPFWSFQSQLVTLHPHFLLPLNPLVSIIFLNHACHHAHNQTKSYNAYCNHNYRILQG